MRINLLNQKNNFKTKVLKIISFLINKCAIYKQNNFIYKQKV